MRSRRRGGGRWLGRRSWQATSLTAGLALALGAQAWAAEPAGLSVRDAWMRVLVPTIPASGYFTLSNASDRPATLVGADSPACGELMMHRSESAGGVSRMEMVDRLPVPPHGSLRFDPGGYHLMCMNPSAELRPGSAVPVTLHFADGGALTARFAVRGARGK